MKVHRIQFIHFFIKKQNKYQLEKSSKMIKKTIQKRSFQKIK